MSYHNLCQDAKTPSGIASLLGMGLQFCIESARPNQRIEEGILRFQRSVRLHFFFAEKDGKPDENDEPDPDNVNYIPGLYLPSTWSPPAAKEPVEFALANFDEKLNDFARALPKHRRHNLSPSQRNVIRELRDRPDLIVYQTDKNLGPSVSERKRYIQVYYRIIYSMTTITNTCPLTSHKTSSSSNDAPSNASTVNTAICYQQKPKKPTSNAQ